MAQSRSQSRGEGTARELSLRKAGAKPPASYWMRYLPEIYHDNEFLDDLLLVFDRLWMPLDRQVSSLWTYFDPLLTPEDFLPWLAGWVALTLDMNWPVEKRRWMIAATAELYKWRGTRRGLTETLQLFTGARAIIEEASPLATHPCHFVVRIDAADAGRLDEALIRRVLDEAKPAHTTYDLILQPRIGAAL